MASQDRVTKISKDETKKLPKGATILSKETSIDVEEIENGFLITKRVEYKYSTRPEDKYGDYMTITKKWYSEDDPICVDTKDKELAEVFK